MDGIGSSKNIAGINKKRYAHLVIGNLRNFQISTRISIVVLTSYAWAAISISVLRVFSGPPIRAWHSQFHASLYIYLADKGL